MFYETQQNCPQELTRVLENFSAEFDINKETRQRLDTRYRMLQHILYKNNSYKIAPKVDRTFLASINLLKEKTLYWQEDQRLYLLSNLVHMHINRIFEHEPRQHEIIVYHFMRKYQLYLNHRASGVIL